MKRKVHRAFLEELPQGHQFNCEAGAGLIAVCFETLESGGTANPAVEEFMGRSPVERAVIYLGKCCPDAEHAL